MILTGQTKATDKKNIDTAEETTNKQIAKYISEKIQFSWQTPSTDDSTLQGSNHKLFIPRLKTEKLLATQSHYSQSKWLLNILKLYLV